MPHAIPVMNAPEGIKTFAYPVAVKTNWKGRKTRGRSYFNKAEEYPGITPEQRAEYIERITRDIGPPFQRRFEDCPKIIPTAHKQPITFDRVLEVCNNLTCIIKAMVDLLGIVSGLQEASQQSLVISGHGEQVLLLQVCQASILLGKR